MKRFKFKFQKLLNIREHLEKEELNKFAMFVKDFVEVQNKVENTSKKKKDMLLNSRPFIENNNIDILIFRENARFGLQVKLDKEKKILAEKKVLLEKARQRLLEVTKKKKSIEIIKNKEWQKYKSEFQKEEQKNFDEIGTNVFLLSKKSS